ncbi:MAG: flagellar motor protein MotB [Desulfobacter sp.]|jgi:chemotaxis protein MotB|uniref:OmpA/MotB family protein n=1 Tax=uncultured Desulfobacter sp. TaxID=240139 RepID=UPI0029C7C60E|nr:flagellar motor protein MotB [uncultured Desulfobacter sp.]MCW8801012.1 flagellar motor protein MotB [Desulfobacter sp.]
MTTLEDLTSELEISELKRLRQKRQSLLEECEPEDASLWAMLDIMTLILAFFIMLYSSQAHMSQALEVKHVPTEVRQPVESVKTPDKPVKKAHESELDLLTIEDRLHQVMEKSNISNYSVKVAKNRLVLTLGEDISFPSGQAKLLDYIKPALKDMASFFITEPEYKIIVAGHTDNTPIHTAQFPSNWELSAARAMSVAKFLVDCRVAPERINIEGFGQYRPIGDNTHFLGREANRRVEISLVREAAQSENYYESF